MEILLYLTMNPVQRPLENVFKHPPIIMDLAVVVALFVVPHTKFPIEMVFWRSAKMVDPDGAVKLTTVRCIHSSSFHESSI